MKDIPTTREIWINGEIDDDCANAVIARLLFFKMEDARSPVTLWVDSIGGSITATLAIVDTMMFVEYPVCTRCKNHAFGMGLLILACGRRGDRLAAPESSLGLTPVIMRPGSEPTDDCALHFYAKIEDRVVRLFAAVTGNSRERVREDMGKSRTFNEKEARSYGLVDRPGLLKQIFTR